MHFNVNKLWYFFSGTVYDYYFQKEGQGHWNVWTDLINNEDTVIPATAKVCTVCWIDRLKDASLTCFYSLLTFQVADLIIPTMETARQMFFLDTYLAHDVAMLFVGPTGTGKSIINQSFLVRLPKDKYTPNCINFSARTSANQTQDIIMSKLDRRRKGVFGPPIGKKCIVYVGKVGRTSLFTWL